MRIKDIIFYIMIIAILGLGIYLVVYVKSESYQCMNNPYVYSINLLEKANGGEVTCTCISPHGSAILTKEGFKPVKSEEPIYEVPSLKFNLTKSG